MSVFLRDGITYAGLSAARRPMILIDSSRTPYTSSLSAMKSDRTHSACARWRSNLGSRCEMVACRMAGSISRRRQSVLENLSIWRHAKRTGIGDGESEELLQDLVHQLDSRPARLIHDGIVGEHLAARKSGRKSYFGAIVLDEAHHVIANELTKAVLGRVCDGEVSASAGAVCLHARQEEGRTRGGGLGRAEGTLEVERAKYLECKDERPLVPILVRMRRDGVVPRRFVRCSRLSERLASEDKGQ